MQESTLKMKGVYTFTVCDVSTPEAQQLSKEIDSAIKRGEDAKDLLDQFHGKYKKSEYVLENIVPTVGRQQIAKALTNNIAGISEIVINKSAIGTGTTTPANGDTTLVTETFRKDIASLTYSSNVAYATAFYTASDTSGTFHEHALFINGTGVADSGTLLSRVILNSPTGITKSLTETLTVDYSFTIT